MDVSVEVNKIRLNQGRWEKMTVFTYNSPLEYESRVQSFLLENEAMHNLPLGIIQRMKTDMGRFEKEPVLGYLDHLGEIKTVLMRTPPHMWILASHIELSDQDINILVHFFKDNHHPVPGMIGASDNVTRFAEAWKKAVGVEYEVHMKQKVFQLDEVLTHQKSPGHLIKATEDHAALAREWMHAFGQEANVVHSEDELNEVVERLLNEQTLRLWVVDGEPVSMVNQSRNTPNGTTVSAVYTPDAHKRKGYATSAVAALSQELLGEGYQFCCLYTDLSNPTSNGIYQKIGYKPVGNSMVVNFI